MAVTIKSFLEQFGAHPRSHEWTAKIEYGGAGSVIGKALVAKGVDLDVLDSVDLLLENHSLPAVALETIEQNYKGSTYTIPKRSTRFGELVLTFKEVVDKNKFYGVWKLFSEWVDLSDNTKTGIGIPVKDLKVDMVLSLWEFVNATAVEPTAPKFSIRYRYVYPTQVEAFEMTNEPTEIVKPVVHFNYDLWKYE